MRKTRKKSKFASEDYLASSLPSTRREQYFDILKNEWRTLLCLGGILLLFALPYLALVIFKGVFLPAYSSTLDVSSEQARFFTIRMSVLLDVLLIPCAMIFSIGLAGASRIYRLLTFGEGFVFRGDFLKGIKQNVRQYLLVSFLFSFLLVLCEAIYIILLSALANDSLAYGISFVPFVICWFVFGPMFLFHLHQVPVYTMKTLGYAKNASKMSIGNYQWSLLFSFIPFVPYFLIRLFGMNFILESVVLALLIVLFLPLYILLLSQVMAHLFDKYLNCKSHPDLYEKGLYVGESQE